MDREEEINAAALDAAVRSMSKADYNSGMILRRAAAFADFIRTGNPG